MTQKIHQINISRIKELANDIYRYAYNSDSRLVNKLSEFYKEAVYCPSVAKAIAKEATVKGVNLYGDMLQDDIASLRGKPWQLVKNYFAKMILAIANIEANKNDPEVKKYYDIFEKEFTKIMYPTTNKIREKIIEDGRVVYGQVTPRKPLGLMDRIRYAKLFAEAQIKK